MVVLGKDLENVKVLMLLQDPATSFFSQHQLRILHYALKYVSSQSPEMKQDTFG